MTLHIESLVKDFEEKRITRRQLVAGLLALMAAPRAVSAQQAVPTVAQARTINHVSIGVSNVDHAAVKVLDLMSATTVSI